MVDNGLKSSSFHVNDTRSERAAEALRSERRGIDAFNVPGGASLSSLDPETVARKHLKLVYESNALPGIAAPNLNGVEGEFKSVGTESLPLTNTKTVKFRQYFNKVPVYGSLVTVELDPDNELVAVNSAVGQPLNVDPVARISPNDALKVVTEAAGPLAKGQETVGRLNYYFDEEVRRWRLVYIFEDVRPSTTARRRPQPNDASLGRPGGSVHGAAPLLMDYVVDAHTGALVAELPRTPSAASSSSILEDLTDGLGVVRKVRLRSDGALKLLHDVELNVRTHDLNFGDIDSGPLPGAFCQNPPDFDGSAVSAHANAIVVASFLREVLLRQGIDNEGGPLISSVNCIVGFESPDGREWRNAAWVGTQMVYGQRAVAGQLRSYAVALDVVAHEIVHGVTDRTARIEYRAEPGALNESYSDIIGVIVSNFTEPQITQWNWQMGEELDGTGATLRDLSDPRRHGQPAHMDDFVVLPNTPGGDFGGVHTNSGIHNKAAHLIMTALSPEGAPVFTPTELAHLFYHALTQHLSRRSGFADSRRGLELAAFSLFRACPPAELDAKIAVIRTAFDSVGVMASPEGVS